uniref:Integral membrane protein n=1 Tax=Streptomyces viridochromogenes TaxID=1938 RepID=G0WV58_STRVR|nr:integral membrane protein [Streptomyces viridochromogenes]
MEMIHLRLVSPVDLTPRAVGLLSDDRYVFNLVVLHGLARHPDGDAIECDILTGAANAVLRGLRELDLDRRGSLVIEPVEMAMSGAAAEAERKQLGALAHAPVWEEVEARIRAEGTYLPSFYVYLAIAGILGAVGIITNSQILIVAAMVVGPEYGAITNVALGIDRGHRTRVRQGLFALTAGFLLAIAVTFLFSWAIRGLDFQPRAFELGIRPVSTLIDAPDFFSVVVAVLAGVVGIMSLTQARTSALLGVFISVTTIPAAADIGVSCAFSSWSEARGSLVQLLLNIVLLIAVGVVALRFQRAVWRSISRRTGRSGS